MLIFDTIDFYLLLYLSDDVIRKLFGTIIIKTSFNANK